MNEQFKEKTAEVCAQCQFAKPAGYATAFQCFDRMLLPLVCVVHWQDIRMEDMVATMPGEHGTGITMMKPGDYDFGGKPKIDPVDVLKEEL